MEEKPIVGISGAIVNDANYIPAHDEDTEDAADNQTEAEKPVNAKIPENS